MSVDDKKNKNLFEFLDHIQKETNSKNDDNVVLSDLDSKLVDDDITKRVSILLDAAKRPNGYIDVNSLIYDMHGILDPNISKNKTNKDIKRY